MVRLQPKTNPYPMMQHSSSTTDLFQVMQSVQLQRGVHFSATSNPV